MIHTDAGCTRGRFRGTAGPDFVVSCHRLIQPVGAHSRDGQEKVELEGSLLWLPSPRRYGWAGWSEGTGLENRGLSRFFAYVEVAT